MLSIVSRYSIKPCKDWFIICGVVLNDFMMLKYRYIVIYHDYHGVWIVSFDPVLLILFCVLLFRLIGFSGEYRYQCFLPNLHNSSRYEIEVRVRIPLSMNIGSRESVCCKLIKMRILFCSTKILTISVPLPTMRCCSWI